MHPEESFESDNPTIDSNETQTQSFNPYDFKSKKRTECIKYNIRLVTLLSKEGPLSFEALLKESGLSKSSLRVRLQQLLREDAILLVKFEQQNLYSLKNWTYLFTKTLED